MRGSFNATVLFFIFMSGCFGNRAVQNDDSDGGDSSGLDSHSSGWRNTGGSAGSLDAQIGGGRKTIPGVCGDDIKQDDEVCDGTDLAGASCGSLMPGYFGDLVCDPDCQNYNTSMCYQMTDGDFCGNGIREEYEVCDGTDLAGASCGSLMPGNMGELYCEPNCQNFNTSMCYPGPSTCGNNIREAGEVCDGFDLGGATCASLMWGMIGSLRCTVDCRNYNTSWCYEDVDDGGVDYETR